MSTCQNMGDYLFVEVSEPFSLNQLITTIHEVADHCQTENLNKVLVDLRSMEGNPNIFERFQLELEISKTWGSKLKVAYVAKPGIINRVMENTAVNRGARVLGTPDMAEAFKWLEVENRNDNNGG